MRCIARVLLVVAFIAPATCKEAKAQENDAWGSATAGVTLGPDTIRFALIEARRDVSHHWGVGAGVAYLDTDAGTDELQLRLTATGTLRAPGKWSFEWRQMLSVSSRDLTRLRGRLRAVRPGILGWDAISFRAFDELYFDLEGAGVLRNNVAAGFGLQLQAKSTIELYHVWVDSRVGRQSDYALLLLSLRF